MFIKIYLFAYSVDKTIMLMCRAPGWGCCWWTMELVPPGIPLAESPVCPEVGGQPVESSSREKVGFEGS